MMMPLPWLFYLMLHDTYGGWDRFTLGLHTFVFEAGAITIATLDSERVLTHQPYESIVLWDDMDDGELEDLALLQRKGHPRTRDRASRRRRGRARDRDAVSASFFHCGFCE